MNRAVVAATQKTTSCSVQVLRRMSSTTGSTTRSKPQQLSYHIEVSNLARKDVTQIVVTGPGVLGLLASMCVTLATKGGSIKELHAAESFKEHGMPKWEGPFIVARPIRDVIAVVDYKTGKAFKDEELHDLAEAVLESTRAPYKVVKAVQQEIDSILQKEELPEDDGFITVIPGKNRFKHL